MRENELTRTRVCLEFEKVDNFITLLKYFPFIVKCVKGSTTIRGSGVMTEPMSSEPSSYSSGNL